MFNRRFRSCLLIGVLGLVGGSSVPAQSPLATTQPVTVRLTEDEVWHRLNTAAGDTMLYVREVEKARLLIVRGLTNDFTQPYTGNVEELSKQQLRWLAAGASILTEQTTQQGTQTTALPQGTQTEKNFNAMVKEFFESGMTPDEFMAYWKEKYWAIPEDPGTDNSLAVWDMIRKWYADRNELARLGDAAQTEALKAYTDYFDTHWSELSNDEKCCINKRLEAVRPGLDYNEFKNRLKFPKSYPKDGLTPKERGKLVVTLTECLPFLAKTEVLPAQQVAKAFANAAEFAKTFVRDASFKILDAATGIGTVAKTAKNFVLDWVTGESEDDGNVEFGDAFLFNPPGGPNERSGRRVAAAVQPARAANADVVAMLVPRQVDLPFHWVALRIEAGRAIIPEPYVGTYDIYLYRPGMLPGIIKDAATDSDRPKTLRVQTPRPLAPSSNAPFRATVNPAPDKPPDPPAVPPLQGCPCKPYRILVTSQASCRPAGTPLWYSSITFEGQAQFDVFDNDYQFPTGTSTHYLQPILVPMQSTRRFWQGEMDNAAFSKAPASLVLNGDLSIRIQLDKPPREQPNSICLGIDVEIARNPTLSVLNSIRDVRTGHVISGPVEEAMFGSVMNFPIGSHTKAGCGFPGRVVIRSDSSVVPEVLRIGCTWVEQVIIEPLDGAGPAGPTTPALPSTPATEAQTPPVNKPASKPASGAMPWAENTNRPGGDYRDFELPRADPAACQAACSREGQCKSWTYVKPGQQGERAHCWLKQEVMTAYPDECCVSGVKGPRPAPAMLQRLPRM